MNWVNVFFILLIVIMVFDGIYRGFLHSALNLGSFFLSIITSYLLYPVVSAAVHFNDTLFKFLLYYTEGAEKITSFEDTSLLIDNISSGKLNSIISSSSLSEPFSTLIRQNVESKAFAADGLHTIGEYFNMTIVCAVLNILSFCAVFILARIVFTFVLGAVNHTVEFPELKQYDRTTGALFGATRGLLLCFLVVIIVPVVFLILPVDKISEYFSQSSIGMFFYQNNFFLHLIRGTV
ncbi:MAG: CvpA family protein [Eubacteriales bacterium]|nr:CvpA family protein [Eubacteriales bacterium]